MLQLLQAVELDLVIEQGGQRMTVRGQNGQFLATFPSLRSLFHFARELWPWRQHKPSGVRVVVGWRSLRWTVLR